MHSSTMRRQPRRSFARLSGPICAVLLLVLCPTPLWAQDLPADAIPDFQFALIQHGSDYQIRERGWSRLSWELRRRTSVAASLEIVAIDPKDERLFDFPIAIWQGTKAVPPLSDAQVLQLRRYLNRGGFLWIELPNGDPGGPFDRSVRRELARVINDLSWSRLPSEHVLYKSFFLVDRHPGRRLSRGYFEAIFMNDRVAVLHSANDMSGALERDAYGGWEFEVESGGEKTREWTARLGINVVMYALCLDYKADQVHIPFILKRRQ